jgi:hypothetical protein
LPHLKYSRSTRPLKPTGWCGGDFSLGVGQCPNAPFTFGIRPRKCRARAARMTDEETRQQLHVLAVEYTMRAVMVESDEPSYGNRK